LISVFGLPLNRAREILASAGIEATFEETRSKKGVDGGTDARVIRQIPLDEGHATLLYAVFRTEPIEANP